MAIVIFLAAKFANGQDVTPYTALVEIGMPGNQGFGSGTLIAKQKVGNEYAGIILSARHVALQEGSVVTINWLSDGGIKTMGRTWKLIHGDGYATDMSLICCEVPAGVQPVKVVKFNPANGPFLSAGYRDGLLRVGGPYHNVTKTKSDSLYVDSPLCHGMSGGALFDRYGNVVGIVIASDTKSWGIFSDGQYLERLLSDTVPMQ